jgi:hypothetical protein
MSGFTLLKLKYMKNWVKIQSFNRLHQAQLRKDILDQNGINSVIINEKDSLFLIGDIELYVEEFNEKKAKALVDEFSGLTKINSFIDMKPLLLFQKILDQAGIKTHIKRRESEKFVLGNYELYVENDKLEDVIPFLTGDKLNGWKKLLVCHKVRQTKFYVDLLAESLVNSIIIKKKDSDYHLELVTIYVKEEDYAKAESIINELKGFVLLKESENLSVVEKLEESLAKIQIKSLIKKNDPNFKLFVDQKKVDEANDYIEKETDWVEIKTFGNIANALYYKSIMDAAEIPSVILNDKDSSFLLGEIELYVEKEYLNKAQELLENLK